MGVTVILVLADAESHQPKLNTEEVQYFLTDTGTGDDVTDNIPDKAINK